LCSPLNLSIGLSSLIDIFPTRFLMIETNHQFCKYVAISLFDKLIFHAPES
jgi:hypothetical protein